MAMRRTKPTSPGRRFATYQKRDDVTVSGNRPHKPLTKGKSSSGGRNARGRVTARHRGGGAKRRYRAIDFKRRKDGVPAKVASIEYDPNRTCYNALPLRSIPTGTVVHNVELVAGQGGKLGRSAGSAIQVVAKEGEMVTLRLPSSEMRMVRAECRATIGTLSNSEHQNVK